MFQKVHIISKVIKMFHHKKKTLGVLEDKNRRIRWGVEKGLRKGIKIETARNLVHWKPSKIYKAFLMKSSKNGETECQLAVSCHKN